jgi:hypothetical protein
LYVQVGMFAARKWKELLIAFVVLFGIIFIIIFGSQQQDNMPYMGDGTGGYANVSPLVRQYEPLVRQYATLYGIEGYTELLLAKMMQESGGRGGDPMQASESMGLPPNTINNPEMSIKQGVFYFSQVLKQAKGDIKITLQSYNFGGGFISYAYERGGYSKEVALSFSKMMAAKMGWTSYGDPNYVDNVLRYLSGGAVATEVNAFGFIKPVNAPMSSRFGFRMDPFTGAPDFHGGNDYGCQNKALPIFSTKPGVVEKAGWQNPSNHREGYGQRVYINHGNGLTTIYGHLSKIGVSVGQKVSGGQQIGSCGTTGSSTGMHLHFELVMNGTKVDPTPYVE